jgi:mRNA interferase RelE/StbE
MTMSLENLKNNLTGNVRHRTDSTAEFRLRVGPYGILFEINGDDVIVYRMRHRRDAYR